MDDPDLCPLIGAKVQVRDDTTDSDPTPSTLTRARE